MSNSFPVSSNPAPNRRAASEPWTRWWVPEEQWDSAGTDQEFLGDNGAPSQSGSPFDDPIPGIAPLHHWKAEPFLLLLGRPGSGKSSELERAADHGWLGPALVFKADELNASDPSTTLDRLVSQHNPPAGTRLIIDGLDEALLVNAAFTERLRGWFRLRIGSDGAPDFKLAISCRWADWPQRPVDELACLWTAHPIRLVLGPLRRSDALATLKSRLGDERAEEFWRQMHAHHLVPIACWPQSFLAMVEKFAASGQIARSHSEAMEAELLRRCRLADSRDDRTRWQASVEGTEWRQRVAARIAAMMTFAGRQSFSTTPDADGAVLSVGEITSSVPENFGQTRRDVTLADVDSVISASSLLRRTDRGYAFAHQVYQELLTAHWLDAQQTDVTRLAQLFGYEEQSQWRSFPNLAAVAASLAAKPSQRPFRQFLLQHDPLVLLRLDAVALSDDERRELFEALLRRTAEIGIVDRGERHALWPSLKYKQVTTDIAALLRDPQAHEAAKELALDAARGMSLHDLVPVLWDVYPGASGYLKKRLARALHELAAKGSDESWLAVLRGEIPIDGDGTLLGAALEFMVPQHVGLGDVAHWIIPERHFDVWGHYQFALHGIEEHLRPTDLPAVLGQFGTIGRVSAEGTFVENLRKSSLKLAFAHFNQTDVREALVNYWFDSLKRHQHPHHDYNEQWDGKELGLEDDDLRRTIAGSLIRHDRFQECDDAHYICASDFLILKSDIEWLLKQSLSALDETSDRFARVAFAFVWDDEARTPVRHLLAEAWSKSPELKRMLPKPQREESLEDAMQRVRAEGDAKRAAESAKRLAEIDRHKTAKAQRMADYEAACMAWHSEGKLVWPQIFHMLTNRGHHGPGGMVEFQTLAKVEPHEAWIREAARRYLIGFPEQKPEPSEDDGMWGLFALALYIHELGQGGDVDAAVRRYWLPNFVWACCARSFGGFPDGFSNERFAKLFPAEFPSAFGSCFARQYCGKSSMEEFKSFLPLWTPELTGAAKRVLRENPISESGFVSAFRWLASASKEDAMTVAHHWLTPEHLPNDAGQLAALLGACLLFTDGNLWTEIEPHFCGGAGKGVFRHAAMIGADRLWHTDKPDFSSWPPEALKSFAEMLHMIAPWQEPRSRGFEFSEVTAEDRIEELRDWASSAAVTRGLTLDFPRPICATDDGEAEHTRYESWQRSAAGQHFARLAWAPLAPSSLLQIATRPSARLARNANELMAAVLESIAAYQTDLIHSNKWDELWNGTKAKDEKRIARHLCDWLKQHLKIPALREPEMPDASRSDIHICGPTGADGRPLTVIIEVKKVRRGNAKERTVAMKTQLLDRYLTPHYAAEGWTHGLYLIAWTPDPGSPQDTNEALQNARDSLRRQAEELSHPPFVLRSVVLDLRHRRQPSTRPNS